MLAHEPIFGVCCGVHTMRGTAAASILCQHRGVLKTMPGTSAALSTAVPIRNARYRSRRWIGAGCNEREYTIMKEHEFTLILTTDPSEEEADRLYGCCDDGTLSTIAGVPPRSTSTVPPCPWKRLCARPSETSGLQGLMWSV